ncbi:transposase [Methylotuvimicrobium alcaliphilum]|uniref:Transposase InsH N-terminal domain-containing protein n=1 Tax=Methylotuvimicrobium alcaliphilum (strain DSM 19304 / NCIMB 14124 / VKM B-2133 / 20Z) TaxID=1091494 RepID=G4T3X5_META2|nr:transposase [Methylotuvimicrobium alcaliphilum]CCE22674.1 protein of unknown function [Methylotuvimicrobium alcaliphilum 20Z]
MLLPLCIDDYVSQNNPVRAIDAYVDTLELYALGFKNTEPVIGAGQPAYGPAALLKLYLYDYLQGISSSRKLDERPPAITPVRGEFSLMMLTYNLTRLLTIPGADTLRDYYAQIPGNILKNVEIWIKDDGFLLVSLNKNDAIGSKT